MERVSINVPGKVLFTYGFKIVAEDINIANHMGNERILVYTNIIREACFVSLGLMKYETFEKGTIIANHSIQYKNEGFLDDEITCEVGLQNLTAYSFDIVFHFIKQNKKTLAMVRTGCVYFNYALREKQHLPDFYQSFIS